MHIINCIQKAVDSLKPEADKLQELAHITENLLPHKGFIIMTFDKDNPINTGMHVHNVTDSIVRDVAYSFNYNSEIGFFHLNNREVNG